jgi:hypothetical protein
MIERMGSLCLMGQRQIGQVWEVSWSSSCCCWWWSFLAIDAAPATPVRPDPLPLPVRLLLPSLSLSSLGRNLIRFPRDENKLPRTRAGRGSAIVVARS